MYIVGKSLVRSDVELGGPYIPKRNDHTTKADINDDIAEQRRISRTCGAGGGVRTACCTAQEPPPALGVDITDSSSQHESAGLDGAL